MQFSSSVFSLLVVWILLPLAAFGQVAAPPQPASTASMPSASAEYRLGPGDSVRISVWTGNDYQDQTLTVAADGTLLLPFFINRIVSVSSMSPIQLRDLVESEMRRVYRNPIVQVIIVGVESKRAGLVALSNNVQERVVGRFAISDNTPILNFVIQNGAFFTKSDLSSVQVTRANGERLKVNVYDLVVKGDKSQNIMLHPEDVVFVPPMEQASKKYYMLGEVRSPGLLRSADDLTLLEAITLSGTLATTARAGHIFVVRQSSQQNPQGPFRVMDISFDALYKHGDPRGNIRLENEDIVYVPKSRRAKIADVLAVVSPVTSLFWSYTTVKSAVSP